jgi:hypothetical protein
MPEPGRAYEPTVLGDLHGCYSCLKATVLQTRFSRRSRRSARTREQPQSEARLARRSLIAALQPERRPAQRDGPSRRSPITFALRGNYEYT